MTFDDEGVEDIYFTARDGLKLHARCYPAVHGAASPARPVPCRA